MFEIKKGIPAPTGGSGRWMYPFATMEVGDCFDVPCDMGWQDGVDKRRNSLCASVRGYVKRDGTGKKFTTRVIKDEKVVRCWRVA